MDIPNRYHSVLLDEEACKGCTLCVTTCPTEAIRVRGGKARIMEERCIDCGKCIRRCPNHAKKARVDTLAEFDPGGIFASFDIKVALPAPSLYGQFSGEYSINAIHLALLECGFDAVFPVSRATG
ncbi:MAG TPA: 4Fe-4S binding protein, partial [Treponemataceae bacterium]|nr:4Fe-4S binding protein [Treponemataceae bacterium]